MADQVGPFYDDAGAATVLSRPGATPAAGSLAARRRDATLLALPTSDGRWIYPVWQFRGHDVLAGLPALLAAFGDASSWSVATWLTTPNVDLGSRPPVQCLEGADVERVLRLARRTAACWET